MARAKAQSDYGTGIPEHVIQSLVRPLISDMLAFFETEEGMKEYEAWLAEYTAKKAA